MDPVEISYFATTPGRVREHADKWNRMTSAEKTMAISSANAAIFGGGQVVNAAQEVASSGSSGNSRPVSRKDDPDTDSGSVQPLDPARKEWMLAAALCEIEAMADMLADDPKLANFKDPTSVSSDCRDSWPECIKTYLIFILSGGESQRLDI